jgi:hypothetical protein
MQVENANLDPLRHETPPPLDNPIYTPRQGPTRQGTTMLLEVREILDHLRDSLVRKTVHDGARVAWTIIED